MNYRATITADPLGKRGPDNELSFSKKLTAVLSAIGSLVGIATLICWLIGDAYSQMVLRSFSIAPQLLDRSFQTVALSGVQILFGWLAEGLSSALIFMLFLVLFFGALRLAWLIGRPIVAIFPLATRSEWKEKWDNVHVPVPSLPSIGVALLLCVVLIAFGSARAIGRVEAVKTISAIRGVGSGCAKGLCPVYVTKTASISGVLVTADKDRMFISTGDRIVAIQVAALEEVKTPVADAELDAFNNRDMPEAHPMPTRPMPASPMGDERGVPLDSHPSR